MPRDFEKFDIILAMDQSNFENLRKMSKPEHHHKIKLMLDYAGYENEEVPDPYYGGKRGFELVLDLIEQASDGLVSALRR